MWNLKLEEIRALLGGSLPRIAVETGTCRGDSARILAKSFEQVVTIELSAELSSSAQKKLEAEGFSNIRFVHGDSAVDLPKLLPSLRPDEPVFFFLDAHWSGDRTVNWSRAKWKGYGFDTAHRGDAGKTPCASEQVPLLAELAAINDHFPGPAHILIDDLKNLPETGPGLRDHEFPGEDWSHLSRAELLKILEPRLDRVHELRNPAQWLISLRSN
ncbi:MAG: hypothetical protein ACXWP5_12135 [Bdellovibrionota bacterium]